MTVRSRILVLGYGNPGRRDDGLGPAAAAAVEALALPHVTVESDYQLSVEDAATVAQHEAVLFMDADRSGVEPFHLRLVAPGEPVSFSSHSLSPAGVLRLAQDLFAARPAAYLLGIRGYEFDEFAEGLSPRAADNLRAAVEFLAPFLRAGTLGQGAGWASQPEASTAPSWG